jgi:hypothetical protein
MGRYLQIRVLAETPDRHDIERAWPRLVAMAFDSPWSEPRAKGGVLELTQILYEKARLGNWPDDWQALGEDIEAAWRVKERLEQALADRDPQRADRLSYELEDALAELEKTAPNP